MSKFDMIEAMIVMNAISLETAEELITAHYDEVESEWVRSTETAGAFEGQ